MNKSTRTEAKLARWGNKTLDHARADGMVTRLRAVVSQQASKIEELEGERDHAYSCWHRCAGLLREAREKNRLLWERLGKIAGRKK